jgi:hypothetical protein
MPLSIKDPDADRLARALARHTGETLTEAVIKALRAPICLPNCNGTGGGQREMR